MKQGPIILFTLAALTAALAATHSAWSTPVAWDVASATRAKAVSPAGATTMRATVGTVGARTCVTFSLPAADGSARRLEIFSVDGARVASLDATAQTELRWTAAGRDGAAVARGAYVARLRTQDAESTTGFALSR